MKAIKLLDDHFIVYTCSTSSNLKNDYFIDLSKGIPSETAFPVPFLIEKTGHSTGPLSASISDFKSDFSLDVTATVNHMLVSYDVDKIYFDRQNPSFGFAEVEDDDLVLFRFYQDANNRECLDFIYCTGRSRIAYSLLKVFIKEISK